MSLVNKLFGSWKNLIKEAGYSFAKSFITECSHCGNKIKKIFSQRNDNNHYFCNHSCAATFTNNERPLSTIDRTKNQNK
jgi:hypothetical protein